MIHGTSMEILSHMVVAGLNWLQYNKPHIDWDTLVLTVQQHSIIFQVYLNKIDLIFCKMI